MSENGQGVYKGFGPALVPSFGESLFKGGHAEGIIKKVWELGAEALLHSEAIKNLPFVVSVIHAGANIRDWNLLKEALNFMEELNAGNKDGKAYRKYREKMDRDPKFASEVLSRILILLDRYIDAVKAKLLARFFIAHVSGEIGRLLFFEFCEITDRMFASDIEALQQVYMGGGEVKAEKQVTHNHERLASVGLLKNVDRIPPGGRIVPVFDGKAGPPTLPAIAISDIGRTYCEIAFRGAPLF